MKQERKNFFKIKSNRFIFNHIRMDVNDTDGFFLHTHEVPELLYIVEADGCHIIEDKEYNLKSGDLIIVPPATHHNMRLKKWSTYERYDICFEPALLEGMDIDRIYNNIKVINCAEQSIISDIFKKSDYYSSALSENDFTQVAQMLIKEIFYNLISYDSSHNTEPNFLSPILSKAIEYINKNLFEIKSVTEISNALFITDSYLLKIFSTQLKTSPKKYLISKRLHAARKEILLGAKPTQIFLKVGFSDYSSFYRSYVNFFGHSPSMEKYYGFSSEKY